MGTRNVTAVMLGGEYRVAQYAQWDGYPEGQGLTILKFLHSIKKKRSVFIKKLKGCHFLTHEEVKETWTECGADPASDSVSLEIADKHTLRYPQLSRDTGATVLDLILKSENGIGLDNRIDFVKDSLFCEWAYVIDFDANTFEIFKGYNQKGLDATERFSTFCDPIKQEFYPVRAWMTFNLKKLPSVKEYLSVTKKKQEKENA